MLPPNPKLSRGDGEAGDVGCSAMLGALLIAFLKQAPAYLLACGGGGTAL